jgi:hypothetical protein
VGFSKVLNFSTSACETRSKDGNKEHVPIELSKVLKFFLKEVAKYLQL